MPTLKLTASKASDRHPQDDELTELESVGAGRIHAGLQAWARNLLRGVSADNANVIMQRMGDPSLRQKLRDAIVRLIRESAEYGVEIGREYVERDVLGVKRTGVLDVAVWDLANEAAASWAEWYGDHLVGEAAMNTTPRIQKLVADWIRNGEPFHVLREKIINGYWYSESRANTIAVTEVTRAFAEGNLHAWRQAGVTDGKRWNTALDEMVCPICAPLHRKIVSLDGQWMSNGETLTAPPAHPRCRCWLTPYIDDDGY